MKAPKHHGRPEAITTDGLRSCGAAMKKLGCAERQETARWTNNRVENSHLPSRPRERAMLRFTAFWSFVESLPTAPVFMLIGW